MRLKIKIQTLIEKSVLDFHSVILLTKRPCWGIWCGLLISTDEVMDFLHCYNEDLNIFFIYLTSWLWLLTSSMLCSDIISKTIFRCIFCYCFCSTWIFWTYVATLQYGLIPVFARYFIVIYPRVSAWKVWPEEKLSETEI